jgi:Na+/melibiose symporter-like transporter
MQDQGQRKNTINKATIARISVGFAAVVTLVLLFAFWLLRRCKLVTRKSIATLKEQRQSLKMADQPEEETESVALYEKNSRPF